MNEHASMLAPVAPRSTPPFTAVALTDGAEARAIMLAICRKLRRRFGSKIYVYVRSSSARKLYERFLGDAVDEIIHAHHLHETALKPVADPAQVLAKARAFETFLGCTYNVIRMTRRDFGLGFYLGGFNHPTSYYAAVPSYEQIVQGFNSIFDFWQKEYDSKGITLHLNGLKEEAVLARARGVPFRFLYASRVENSYFWAHSEMIDYPEVAKVYRAMEGEDFAPLDEVRQYYADVGQRRRIVRTHPLVRLAKRMVSTTMGYLYRFKHRENFTPTYYFMSVMRYLVREYRDMKKLRAPRATRLADLKGRRIVYFPLHTEPEMSLHWMSPEYFSQLWAIASLARDLPADAVLAVKETIYGVGRRPRDFYEQILRLKNTVILDVYELGVDVVKAADVVATITGTAGLEAAILGKPVIMFGRHNFYDCAPHIRKVFREEDLKAALDYALSDSFDRDQARRDGARLRAATLSASFDLGKYSNLALKAFTDEDIERATDALVAGLVDHVVASSTRRTADENENRA